MLGFRNMQEKLENDIKSFDKITGPLKNILHIIYLAFGAKTHLFVTNLKHHDLDHVVIDDS